MNIGSPTIMTPTITRRHVDFMSPATRVHRFLEVLRDKPLSMEQIITTTRFGKNTCKAWIPDLVDCGMVERIEPDYDHRAVRYRLASKWGGL